MEETAPAALSEILPGVFRARLPNRLTVLAERRACGPVVALVTWVRAGYLDEEDRLSGVSHLLEHLLFTGSRTRPSAQRFAEEARSIGAQLNASTHYDRTAYHLVLPAEHFRRGLELAFDGVFQPLIDPEVLKNERGAVLQEERRKRDNPSGCVFEMWMGLGFRRHRLGRWRMGEREQLLRLSREDLLEFFEARYRAENVVIALVGDVDPGEAVERAAELYGKLPGGAVTEEGGPEEPRQESFRYRRETGDISQAYLVLGFHAPGALEEASFALDVAAFILGSGRSSRLYRRLREKLGLVNSIAASSFQIRDRGVFQLAATADPGQVEPAERAMAEEIERMAGEPVTKEEFERAARAIETGHYLSQGEVLGRAMSLCFYESLGGAELSERYLEGLLAVDANAIQEAVAAYLRLSNACLVEYVPARESGDAPSLEQKGQLLTAISRPEPALSARLAPCSSSLWRTRGGPRGEVSLQFLSNGAAVVLIEDHSLPLVSLSIYFRAGRLYERPESAGLTQLMVRSSIKGACGRSAEEIASALEALGTSLHPSAREDYFGYGLTVLSRHLEEALDLVAAVVTGPDFPDAAVDREKQDLLADLRRAEDQAFHFAFRLFRQSLFTGHPYGYPDEGTEEAISGVGRRDLAAWHQFSVRAENLVLSLAGDLRPDRLLSLLSRQFSSLPAQKEGESPVWRAPEGPSAPRIVERRREQTATIIGFPAASLPHPDRYPLELLQNLTGGLGGRFFRAIRGERGLAYSVAPFHYARLAGGAFAVFLATSPDKADEAEAALWEEIERLRREGARPEELELARQSLGGAHRIALQTLAARSAEHAKTVVYGLGLESVAAYPERLRSCREEDLLRVAQSTFDRRRVAKGQVRGGS